MSNPVADSQIRRKALTPDKSFIIQAPAGSGKTGLLIQRYLKLLSVVDAPESIIAITFTRKAAAEMQTRILDALLEAITGNTPETEHAKTTYELACAALKRDQEKGWHITQQPGRLRIQTIDALCAVLTRQMPVVANLGTQPETVEDANPLYQQAAEKTLAELESGEGWSNAIADLVFHLDNDLPRIKRLIVDMLRKRDQWLPHVVQDHERTAMEQALVHLVEDQLRVTQQLFPEKYKDEILSLLRFAAEHIPDENNPLASCKEITQFPEANAEDFHHWRAINELLLTQKGTWRKQFNVKTGFPAASDNKLEADERSERKLQAQSLINKLQDVAGLQQNLATIRQLPSPAYTDNEWSIVKALCDLLTLAAVQLRVVFAEYNQMDFIGVAEAAVNALGEDQSPTDLALHLDYQIQHLLVDEYQDISANQYRLLQRLTREWSLDDGRSLFLVGDPMQSIYRFREAEVALFIRTFHSQTLGNVLLEALTLDVNFRSQTGLVDWVNESFISIFSEKDDMLSGAVSFKSSIAFDQQKSSNNVRFYPLYNRDDLTEAKHVCGIIDEIWQAKPQDTIAILVRSRAHLLEIVPALKQANLRFQAIDIEGLANQSAIQDLLALTRAYLYEGDRVAWLACLRAPWCGLSLESLLFICDGNQDKTVWQCITDRKILSSLTAEQRENVIRLKKIFEKALSQKQRLPIRYAIESLWYELGGPATLKEQIELENCMTYLSLLEDLELGGTIEDLQQLIDNVKKLYAAPDSKADERLQLMTIHKAKGLEFDHVIIPGLGRSPRSASEEMLVWFLQQREKEKEDLILAPIRETGSRQAPIYNYINETDKARQRHEDARLLYVATTRAKKTLHLIGHAALKEDKGDVYCEPQRRSLLSHLWPTVENVYQQFLPETIEQRQSETLLVINQENRRLNKNWILPEPSASVIWKDPFRDDVDEEHERIEFEWAGETIKHIGSVVHRLIQLISEQGLQHWDKKRIQSDSDNIKQILAQLGVPQEEQAAAVKKVTEALSNMLIDERGQWILSKEHLQQANEYAISGIVNKKVVNAVLDRTFIDKEGIRWIIDYKTSRHEGVDREAFLDHEQERYQDQLNNYATLMQGLGDENIRLGLYFPLLNGWREWPFDK